MKYDSPVETPVARRVYATILRRDLNLSAASLRTVPGLEKLSVFHGFQKATVFSVKADEGAILMKIVNDIAQQRKDGIDQSGDKTVTPPKLLTTAEVAQATAAGDDYIRTKNNEVRGLALNPKRNPDAPDIVVVGKGPRIEARARLFLDSGLAVPVYLKRKTNAWEYLGQYRATALRQDHDTIQKYGVTRPAGTVAGVLFLEDSLEPKLQVSGGGFADPETRKEIEVAAITFVTSDLNRRGFQVNDHQRENRGYDLLAVSTSSKLLVEVKGTDSLEPRFFLTRNERRFASKQSEWRLFVVCNARSAAPILHEYTADEMQRQFTLDPLAWECTRNDSCVAEASGVLPLQVE